MKIFYKKFIILLTLWSITTALNLNFMLANEAQAFSLSEKEKSKVFRTPLSIPFDITKAGNQLEFKIQIKEKKTCWFELKFYDDDPRYPKYKPVIYEGGGFFDSNFMFWTMQILGAPVNWIPEKIRKNYTNAELDEALKERNRIIKLIGGEELVSFSGSGPSWEGRWTKHLGISTPLRLIVIKIDGDNQVNIADKITEPGKIDNVGFNMTGKTEAEIEQFKKEGNVISIQSYQDINGVSFLSKTTLEPGANTNNLSRYIDQILLEPGIYKIKIEALKDSPEFAGTKMNLIVGAGRRKY